MTSHNLSLLAPFLIFAVVCSPASPSADAGTRLKIIVTTDVHGRVMADPAKGEIGYALLKSYVDEATSEGWRVFLMDSGDVFSGNAHAQADHGRSIARLLGMMGYSVLTPGNHAFDHNAVEKDRLYYGRVLLQTVRANASGQVAVVAANLTLDGGEYPGVSREPVVIHDETATNPQGTRLVAIGVLTPYTYRPSLKDGVPGHSFGRQDDSAKTGQDILDRLTDLLAPFNRPEDVVVVLSHLGYAGPEGDKDGRITGPDLARLPNVDFVADGHTHTAFEPKIMGATWYGNGGRHLQHFLEMTVDSDGAGMALKRYEDVAHLAPDPVIQRYLDEFDDRLGLSETVFELPIADAFSDEAIRTDSVPLGRLICRTMMRTADADFALHNVGGIRAGLPSGRVSFRALFDVLPFGDDLVTVSLSGARIREIFDRGSGHGGRGFPQFYGLTVYGWRQPDGRVRCAGILDGQGAPLDPDRQYKVAMNSIMGKVDDLDVTRNFGELIHILKTDLAEAENLRLDEVVDGTPLFLFPDEETARLAWDEEVR